MDISNTISKNIKYREDDCAAASEDLGGSELPGFLSDRVQAWGWGWKWHTFG